jgi:hypothetical protein
MALERLRSLSLSVGSVLGWRPSFRSQMAPWGDGLVEQPLESLWYPSRWDEVGADELVFLIPSLATQTTRAEDATEAGPLATTRRALSGRVYNAACALREPARDSGDGSVEALDVIALSGALTTIDPFEAWAEGRAAAEMPYARVEASRERWRSLSSTSTRDACIFELAVVACLDRMHSDARKLAGQLVRHGDEKSRSPITLPDVLVASIYATFNAAYVYPQFACAQEFLSVGAWLGNLVKGRAALMPLFVAEYLAAELNLKRAGDETEGGRCTNILRFHAEQAVGIERLYEFAQRVKATGRPVLVKPRPMPAFGFMPYAWNVPLFQQINQRLGSDRLAT